MLDKEQIKRFFKEKAKKPLSFKEASYLLNLSQADARAFKKILRRLVIEGDIVRTKKGLYGTSEEMELVTGYYESHGAEFGFVIPERPGMRDIFIPQRDSLYAMNNDRVMAQIEHAGSRKGRVVRILQRAYSKITGTLISAGGMLYVRPKSRFMQFDVHIPPKFSSGAQAGRMVIAEITDYPSSAGPARGRIVKTVEKALEPKAETDAIIEQYGFSLKYPKAYKDEIIAAHDRKPGLRKDLSSLTTVTIDGERARDFDDAVSIKLEPDGYTLWVHIADVGHYVAWDSIIDTEARARGTSVYFPDRAIHMLPSELSEDLCSLKPKVQRLAFTCRISFDRSGAVADADFHPSVIQSRERMTYTSVRKILVDNDQNERHRYDTLLGDFELMAELAGLLRQNRLRRGSLDFDLPEPEVLFDVQGMPEAILKAERNLAHVIIEEFMIAANEAVARRLYEAGVPSLYRIHEEPEPDRLREAIEAGRRMLGTAVRFGNVEELLAFAKGRQEEEMVTWGVLRSLKQAKYSVENVGHYGLASECYTHFTSPIRRYPDLVVHRVLREALSKKGISDKRAAELGRILPDIAYASSRAERIAEDAENESVNALRMWFMKDKTGDEFSGRVVGVNPRGLRVRLDDIFVDGFLHVSALTDDFYIFDEFTMSLKGKNRKRIFKPGQALTVRLDRVDLIERELLLGLP